jgi:hypothetical protein
VKEISHELLQKQLLAIEKQRTERAEIRKLTQSAARAAFSSAGIDGLRDDKTHEAALKKMHSRRDRLKRPTSPKFPDAESFVDTGSMSWFKAPPYDDSWSGTGGSFAPPFNEVDNKSTGEMSWYLTADRSYLFTTDGGSALSALGVLFYSSEDSPAARFSAFTWRSYRLHAFAPLFDYSDADYKIGIQVHWLTGPNAGIGWGKTVANDSTWSSFWVDGEASGELYESFQFDFPIFADTWNMLYITTEATAYGEDAYSSSISRCRS